MAIAWGGRVIIKGMTGAMLNSVDAEANIGIVTMPTYAGGKDGTLYETQNKCLIKLANSGLDTDNFFTLLFTSKCDEREKRYAFFFCPYSHAEDRKLKT